MNIPSVDSLMERFKVACDFRQAVDRARIESAMLAWWKCSSDASVTVRFAEKEQDIIDAAWAARAARAAWDARDARDARAAWAAWDARAAWAAWDARAARAAWDISWISITAIGAAQLQDENTCATWIHLLEALEAGAWHYFVTERELVVITIPSAIHTDAKRRLHSSDGHAFEWMDIQDFYWHGVTVTEQIVMHPETLTVQQVNDERNTEVRRVMLECMGTERYVRESGAIMVASDKFGTIWRIGGRFTAVEVINATRETDGSYKHYWLQIDPSAYNGDAGRVPQAAVASTWRRSADDPPYFRDWRDYHFQPRAES